jgi:hypothetical protein
VGAITRRPLAPIALIAAAAVVAACASAPSPSTTTGLTGVVMRGPVTPVCRVDVPCDAPFSATFTVEQDGRRVAQFQSDAAGQFTIYLKPGAYTVVPAADAPIIGASFQRKSVTVADNGMLTVVRLTFDTGIR